MFERVRVVVAELLAASVTEVGLNVKAGNVLLVSVAEAESVTVPAKPLMDFTVMVLDGVPEATVTADDVGVRVKSGQLPDLIATCTGVTVEEPLAVIPAPLEPA